MTALIAWLKHLSGKFYALMKIKNETNSKKQETNSNVPEKWRDIQRKRIHESKRHIQLNQIGE